MTVDSLASRVRVRAATRGIAASSVAPVPFRYERSLHRCAARVSRPAATTYAGGDL